jgi:hypothetical protein
MEMSWINTELVPRLVDMMARRINVRNRDIVAQQLRADGKTHEANYVQDASDEDWKELVDTYVIPQIAESMTEAEDADADAGAQAKTPFWPPTYATRLIPARIFLKQRQGRREDQALPALVIEADHVTAIANDLYVRAGIGPTTSQTQSRIKSTKYPDPICYEIKHTAPGINPKDPSHTDYIITRKFKKIMTIKAENIERIEPI